MRNAFANEITSLAAVDERIVLLSGDIGNRLFDDFKRVFPTRFYNCGVAEANMTGVAAGNVGSYPPISLQQRSRCAIISAWWDVKMTGQSCKGMFTAAVWRK